jgi:MerR family copper efflux transcriptional regulator
MQPNTSPTAPCERNLAAETYSSEPYLHIGRLAALTGASRKAIRHYESLGLLPPPRRKGKYRIYSDRDVFLLHLIKQAQALGFHLLELKDMLVETVEKQAFPFMTGRALIERKRAEIHARIGELQDVDRRLVDFQAEMCRAFGPGRRETAPEERRHQSAARF